VGWPGNGASGRLAGANTFTTEGGSVAGIVLALAGLTCGDGGPGLGAARAACAPVLEGRWVGVARGWFPGEQDFWDCGKIEVNQGVLRVKYLWAAGECRYRVALRDGGKAEVFSDTVISGTYRFEGTRVTIRLDWQGGKSEGVVMLWILDRVQPPKR
jgi:hypothetical protein